MQVITTIGPYTAVLEIRDILLFSADPDPDPWIRTSDKWIRIRFRIQLRIRLLSSLSLRMQKNNYIFFSHNLPTGTSSSV